MAPIERLPKWLLCVPLVAHWFWLAFIYRSATLPSVLNPGIATGGLVGESKFSYLAPIGSRFREWIAETHPVAPADDSLSIRQRYGLAYPLIAKPDIGWCGYGVRRIDGDAELIAYANAFPRDATFLLQRFARETNEAGILYVREPDSARGRVTALTVRHLPHVVSDGAHTVEQLIDKGERTQNKATLYRQILGDEAMSHTPAAGERVDLTTVASVRVGGRYEDLTHLITPQLDAAVDAIARAIGDFHYGRFDVKFESTADLQQGRFTVIEINGAGSEAIQFWDPHLSMREAFAGVFAKQRNLFALADAMRQRGHRPITWRALAAAHFAATTARPRLSEIQLIVRSIFKTLFALPSAAREGQIPASTLAGGHMADFAVPTLPMHNPKETRAFYEKLGFICAHEQEGTDTFLFMIRDGVRLQFFEAPGIDGTIRDHTCYIYVDDLDATYKAFAAAKVGKLMPVEMKPWGVPEFVLIDINGNALRVGCPRLEV